MFVAQMKVVIRIVHFKIGMHVHISHEPLSHILGLRFGFGIHAFFPVVIVIEALELVPGELPAYIVFEQFFPPDVDPVVQIPDVQHIVKDVVAGQDLTSGRNLVRFHFTSEF